MLFTQTIKNWNDWGAVYDRPEAFGALANEALRRSGLPAATPVGMTPGTNAVFRCGEAVVKLYVPAESGLDTTRDWNAEWAFLRHAQARGVAVPRVYGRGEIEDRYLFRYLILEYVHGREAGDVLPGLTAREKADFASQLRGILSRLRGPVPSEIEAVDLLAQMDENERWEHVPQELAAELKTLAHGLDLRETTLVHGDLTRENVLIDPAGRLRLIDFADCQIAPAWYELPPIVFDLLACDRELVKLLIGDADRSAFLDALLASLALHDFGGDILRDFLARNGENVRSVEALRTLLGTVLLG